MMINLKLPDELYNEYLQKWGSPGNYRAMKDAIEAFKGVAPHDRVLLIPADKRRELEAIFGVTISEPDKLIRLTKNLCSYQINGVELNFTDEQLARIQMQAKFHGRTAEVYIKETLEELINRFMEEV